MVTLQGVLRCCPPHHPCATCFSPPPPPPPPPPHAGACSLPASDHSGGGPVRQRGAPAAQRGAHGRHVAGCILLAVAEPQLR